MKIRLLILILVVCVAPRTDAGDEHLKDPISPILTPALGSEPEKKGVWLPNTYGGVTGLRIDLDQVGSDKMLSIRFGTADHFQSWLGKNYKIHSDKTTTDKERGRSERTVVLVDDESLQEFGRKQIIAYKIHASEARTSAEGVPLSSESTYYSFTIGEMTQDFEILYFIQFGASFPNSEYPILTKPPKSPLSP